MRGGKEEREEVRLGKERGKKPLPSPSPTP
jgi:hypothetical protein